MEDNKAPFLRRRVNWSTSNFSQMICHEFQYPVVLVSAVQSVQYTEAVKQVTKHDVDEVTLRRAGGQHCDGWTNHVVIM